MLLAAAHAQGHLVFSDSVYRLPQPLLKGQTAEVVLRCTNTGDAPVLIWQVQSSCYCVLSEKPKQAIAPGDSAHIRVKIQSEGLPAGPFRRHLLVISNAVPPEQLLRIEGVVEEKK